MQARTSYAPRRLAGRWNVTCGRILKGSIPTVRGYMGTAFWHGTILVHAVYPKAVLGDYAVALRIMPRRGDAEPHLRHVSRLDNNQNHFR